MIKRKNQYSQEENRYQIVEFLKNKKGTQKAASELFGISLKTVSNVWLKYKKGGKKALKSRKRSVKEGKKITAKQAWEVRNLIIDNKLLRMVFAVIHSRMPFNLERITTDPRFLQIL